jgi:hypothetical protein
MLAMEHCVFTVRRREATRWHVYETGLAWSLASFGLKEDAVEFARDLARFGSTAGPDPPVADPKGLCERASA